MIFTLEALRAQEGDSLVLHFGDAAAPRFIVIDGGPDGVYADALRPRLDELARRWPTDGQLALEVLMVSHMDGDHIEGVLELSEELLATIETEASPFLVKTLWHNAFTDVVGDDAADGATPAWTRRSGAVVASVPEARRLRDNAAGLGWEPNVPFDSLVAAPETGGHTERFGPLSLTVVNPLKPQIEALRRDWQKKLHELQQRRDEEAGRVAAYLDRSVYNLSSIVCLAELGGKRMLLTGDALGRHVLDGLEQSGTMEKGGTIEVDLLKVPHHGSSRNVAEDFFRRIQARHYVISANGKDGNPEKDTLEMISRTRADGPARDDFTIHLTYDLFREPVEDRVASFLDAERAARRTYKVERRADPDLSLRVDLLDPVEY